MEEHLACNERVLGSSPNTSILTCPTYGCTGTRFEYIASVKGSTCTRCGLFISGTFKGHYWSEVEDDIKKVAETD